MPYVPIYNAASDIIAAFEAGKAARRQREQDQLKKDQDARDYQEKVRQFNEQLKLQEQETKANEAFRQSQVKHQQAIEGIETRKAIAGGLLKPNVREDLAPGQNWAMNNPQTTQVPLDYTTTTGLVLPGSSLVLPKEYSKTLAEQDLAKQSGEIEMNRQRLQEAAIEKEKDRELRKEGLDIQRALAESMMGYRDTMAGIAQQNADTRRMMKSQEDKTVQAGKKQVVNIVQSLKADPIYKRYVSASEAYNWVTHKDYYKNSQGLPGLRQVDLIYKYLQTQDSSVVKPTEWNVALAGAMSAAQSMGYKVRKIFDPSSPLLSPAAEESMRYRLAQRNKIVGDEFEKLVRSKYELLTFATDQTPDYNTFRKMVYDSGMNPATSLPPLPQGFTIEGRVK